MLLVASSSSGEKKGIRKTVNFIWKAILKKKKRETESIDDFSGFSSSRREHNESRNDGQVQQSIKCKVIISITRYRSH